MCKNLHVLLKYQQLESVAIANALQLEGRPMSRPVRFNYDAHAKFEIP